MSSVSKTAASGRWRCLFQPRIREKRGLFATNWASWGKRPKKNVGKRPKPLCWKTAETFWVVGKRPKTSCWKTAEISAVFQQSPHKIVDGLFSALFKQLVVVVRKRQKFLPFSNKIPTKWLMVCFLPFSNNHSKLLENGRNFCHLPTMPPLKCLLMVLICHFQT